MGKQITGIQGQTQHRELSLNIKNKSCINEENRTVEVAFSSEAEVQRWYGIEVLEHSNGVVHLERLNNGGAVLVDHDRTDQVGVIESARIDSDGVGRAVLRFGKSVRAEEIWQDVIDGIRTHISVGYDVIKYAVIEEDGKPDLIRVMEWLPKEISFVSVPADDTVGVGRSDDENLNTDKKQENIMPKKDEAQRADDKKVAVVASTPTVDIEAIRAEERARTAEITTAAEQAPFDLSALRSEAIEKGWSPEKFRSAAFEVATSQKAPAQATMTDDMMKSEKKGILISSRFKRASFRKLG